MKRDSMRRPPRATGLSFRWSGLFLSADVSDSLWIRERGILQLPCALEHESVLVEGELRPDNGNEVARGPVGLALVVNGRVLARHFPEVGSFAWRVPLPPNARRSSVRIELRLLGVGWTNTLAFLGRIFSRWAFAGRLQPYREQWRNKRLRIRRIAADDETIVDFGLSASAFDSAFVTRHARTGLNLVGWFRAELGVGESVRCAARAAAAAGIPHALVPLKLYCRATQGDHSFDDRLQDDNPYPVNVIHIDAPQSRDIDHHHGRGFRRNKYTVGYWAWELPEFPDGWLQYCDYVDEIWTPSQFTRDAIAAKAPVPVMVMPHAIDFPVPPAAAHARRELGLPEDRYLFLFAYDLNSYQERKNPLAVLRAYRRAFGEAGRPDVGVVIKVHGLAGHDRELEQLRRETAGLEGCRLIAEAMPRQRLYLLQQACDAFVSLHRSEGFGLAVAESMFLGKPVISTDWSATSEYVTPENGCPVACRLIPLTENHGPYTRGQIWADPDLEHAAWHMRRLTEDRALGRNLGARAAETIRQRFSPVVVGRLYASRLRAMALW